MARAVPAPPVRAAGSRVTAAMYGSDVTDDVTFLANPPEFTGTQATVQSIASTTWTPIALDTAPIDTDTGHNNVTNNSRYVIPFAGNYTVNGVYASTGNATGFRAARIQVNGSPVLGLASYVPGNSANEVAVVTPTRTIAVNAGDYIEVAGWQSSGGALNTSVVDVDMRSGLWVRFSHA